MPEFYYQIKGKENGHWLFPPLWSDKVVASDRKQAKEMIEEQYGRTFPTRVLKRDTESNEFLLVIKEIKEDDFYTKKLFEVCTCKKCGMQYKVIEKYQFGNSGGSYEFCSSLCKTEYNIASSYIDAHNKSGNGRYPPIIYKITNKINGKCYIGKTTQPFTLRWYQHFFQTTGTKFHTAIKEFSIIDWHFEVLEIIAIPEEFGNNVSQINDFIFEKETQYIKLHDSIRNGYNTFASRKEQEEDLQMQLFQEPEANSELLVPEIQSLT